MCMCEQWELLKREKMSDYKSTGIHLRHKQTGMEVFHLFNDDEENLFAFGFKTLNNCSNGAAHVLEHSVLCGSKHYPLKDPFMQLNSQSVKTFLNAMTFPDKTLYPAASMVKADYFNLMAVYGDAVFFPLLRPEIFAQEAHRYEIDKNGNLSVQGVVYNEMKGSYSSFDAVVSDFVVQCSLPNTPYAFDSGGDPADIPSLTLEKLKDFHREHYSPSKCRLFLYGNIPTEMQLDFIEKRFLSSFNEKNYAAANTVNGAPGKIEKTISFKPFDKPHTLSLYGPSSSGEKGATVVLNWVLGNAADTDSYMEAVLLSEILVGHDASPLLKALLDSGLGEDIAPHTGLETELPRLMFSCGMRGVKAGNADKIEGCVTDVLQSLAAKGIGAQDVQTAVMAVDFSQREVLRSAGPWSLVLMRRSFRGWLNGADPFSPLKTRAAFERIKSRILSAEGKDYLQTLIKRHFLDNPHRLLLTVTPDLSYDAEREKKYAQSLLTCTQKKEDILKQQQALHTFQQNGDGKRSLIPHIKPAQLEKTIDRIHTEKTCENGVCLFVHNEAVNGIVYVTAAFPVDILEPSCYPLLPFYAQALTNTGFKGMDWAQAAAKIAHITGGFSASVFTSAASEWAQNERELNCNELLGRDWLFVRVKTLAENAEQGIDLLFDCFETADFSDAKRLHTLALEYRNDFASSVIPAGHEYALSRCACAFSRSKAVEEMWSGLSQLYTAQKIASCKAETLCTELQAMHKKLKTAGIVLNITADDTGLKRARKALAARSAHYSAPAFLNKSEVLTLQDFLPFTLIEKKAGAPAQTIRTAQTEQSVQAQQRGCALNVYTAPSQTGFAAACFSASAFGTKKAVYESLFAHWFTNNVLWEKIRTVGGAYGAFAFADSMEKVFSFVSYRDPDPARSLDVFFRCLEKSSDERIQSEVLERAVTGCYSKEVQPRSPSARGFTGFIRALYGIRDEEREQKLDALLSATASDVQKAARALSENAYNAHKSILCGKYTGSTGTIIALPL